MSNWFFSPRKNSGVISYFTLVITAIRGVPPTLSTGAIDPLVRILKRDEVGKIWKFLP